MIETILKIVFNKKIVGHKLTTKNPVIIVVLKYIFRMTLPDKLIDEKGSGKLS